MTLATCDGNRKAMATRDRIVKSLDNETLVRGFYGEVVLTWGVQDGVIQKEIRQTVSKDIRSEN
jgi:hypothetical protein